MRNPPVIEAKLEAPASSRPAETPDPVIVKAKTTIAAKLEDPASAEFGEMKRAMRKNTFGKSVDTICGRVKRKKPSGEDAGDWPFLYLVTEDEAYVVNGACEFGGGERVSQYLQLAWNDRTAARICCNGPEGPSTTFATNGLESREQRRNQQQFAAECVGQACSMENGNQNWWSD